MKKNRRGFSAQTFGVVSSLFKTKKKSLFSIRKKKQKTIYAAVGEYHNSITL
jgi:hypothetical protein